MIIFEFRWSQITIFKRNIAYFENEPEQENYIGYETDILIFEKFDKKRWKPRIIIETKINSVTTHDAITYSQKAQTHKYVHPY